MLEDWPKPPIWPEYLPLIRQLLTEQENEELLSRLVWVLPDGALLERSDARGR